MKDHIGKNCLVTCQNWFTAPDGKQYISVFGKLKAVHEAGKTLGFIPNRSHANWFIEIGNMIIMGCQVMYFIQTDDVNFGNVDDWSVKEEKTFSYNRPTKIYNAGS